MPDRAIPERFVEAVITGNHCGTSDSGPRRYAALSLSGLGILTRRKLWPEAMRRIVGLGAHPRAQERFLDAWCRVPMARVRDWVGDDELFFAGLRVLLPAYNGPETELFRGQLADEPIGASWARTIHIARKFVLYGCEKVDPHNLSAAHWPPRENAVVLLADVPPDRIICAPCLLGFPESEYIVDPRGMDVKRMQLTEARS